MNDRYRWSPEDRERGQGGRDRYGGSQGGGYRGRDDDDQYRSRFGYGGTGDDDYRGERSQRGSHERGGRGHDDDARSYGGGMSGRGSQDYGRSQSYGQPQRSSQNYAQSHSQSYGFEDQTGQYGGDWDDQSSHERNRGYSGQSSGRQSHARQSSGRSWGGMPESDDRYGSSSGRSMQGRGGSMQRGGQRSRGSDDDDRGFLERAGDTVMAWLGDDDAARRNEQNHRGKGPSGYSRSDERIREDVCDHLTDDWRLDAGNVQVRVEQGEVTLDGTVSSREEKRRAEDCVEHISGVRHVQNNLRIADSHGNANRNRDMGAGQSGMSSGGTMGSGSMTGSAGAGSSGSSEPTGAGSYATGRTGSTASTSATATSGQAGSSSSSGSSESQRDLDDPTRTTIKA